jgi:predicted alpha/beta hydrolase
MPSPQSLTEPGTSQALENTADESMPGTGRGDPSSPVARDVVIPARDGFSLGGTVFRRGLTSRSVVIVNSATAVPQRFYRHYAQALADAGFIVVTYDYRGTGSSRPTSLKGFEARASDWGLLDMAGVVDWAHERFAPAKLLMIGHSVGGQVTGLLDNSKLIDGMMTISSQSGHWRLQGAEQKWVVGFHVHVTLPLVANMFGYVPWSRLGSAEDLPKGVALEWSRWCRDPKYLLGDNTLPLERFAGFRAPVLAYSIDDDKWGTRRAIDAMMCAYPNVERRYIDPAHYGLKSLGHLGYFRPAARDAWEEGIAWLKEVGA